jgi:4-hydroxy-tetrahydrodipicolinate synthase
MLRPDDLRGKLFPAVPVPLRADGRVHAEAQALYVEHLGAQPIGGVAVWAHTGRGLRLTADQRAEVLTAWKSGLDRDRIVIASAGGAPGMRNPDEVVASALSMARQAADLGADALLVHPPVAFRGHPDQDRLVLEFHAALAEASLPLILFYLYEAAGGIAYVPHVLAQLLARPEVLGIKVATLDSVMTFQQVANLVRMHFPDKVVVTGEDRFLGYSLMCGAEAALIGMGAACADLQAALLQSYLAGDATRFLALNTPVDDLAQHTFISPMEGYILRMLWCLVHQGIIPAEAAHDPWAPRLGTEEIAQIRTCLERIGQLTAAPESAAISPAL